MGDQPTQRRLAAVIAADVAGYTRLMEQDTDGTVAAWQAACADIIDPTVAGHSGRIVKLTGDGFLAEFATVQDAVKCAIAMQEGLGASPLNFRMGVNLGDIVDDGKDIHGEGVNVAARLEGLADPGGICISGSVHEQVRNRIEANYEDLGEQQVKHVSAPVRVYRVVIEDEALSQPGTQSEVFQDQPLALTDKPSIAVLPFDNMSGDSEQEYFSDGISEDIITALSRFNWFFVIARNSSFSYKGTSPDVRQVARDLGVQYVLEGSVRKVSNRVRISAQLIDATTGRHIWAERFDRELDDIFAVQDEITEAIIGAVAPAFVSAEARRAGHKATENLDVWDLAMRGNWHMWRLSRENISEAQRLFERAIAIEPDSSVSQIGLAFAYLLEAGAGWAADLSKSLDIAFEAAQRALSVDDQDAMAHAALALALHISLDNRSAVEECQRALDLNSNLAFAEGMLGLTQAHLGEYDEANQHLDVAQRLSPRDQTLQFTNMGRVISSLVAERYEEYLERTKTFTKASPLLVSGWRHVAAAHAILGRLDEARAAIAHVLELSPNDSLEIVRQAVPIVDANAKAKFMDGLREAGLPEH